MLRETIARCLGLERAQVIALSEDVGGSFGAKNHPYPEYIMAAAISRLLKRPVRWVASRSEDGHTTGSRTQPISTWRSPPTVMAASRGCVASIRGPSAATSVAALFRR